MPLLSVLTPTWNRASYVERVWAHLAAQTSTDFEWIVADDGSDDGTEQVVHRLARCSRFPVLYLRAAAHVGKARMDNEAVARARGELVLWCDSDELLVPQAIERLLSVWLSIPEPDRAAFVGMTALLATQGGVVADPFPDGGPPDVSWNDLAEVHHVTTDMLYVARADMLRSRPFPEVDLVIPESAVWNQIGEGPTRYLPEVLKIAEYRAPHAISFSGKMAYNRGRAHAAAITQRALGHYRRGWRVRAWRLITFVRYCLLGEIRLGEARALWRGNSSMLAFWAAVPFASGLAGLDVLRGKVVRSHREFLANRHSPVAALWLREEGGP